MERELLQAAARLPAAMPQERQAMHAHRQDSPAPLDLALQLAAMHKLAAAALAIHLLAVPLALALQWAAVLVAAASAMAGGKAAPTAAVPKAQRAQVLVMTGPRLATRDGQKVRHGQG